jgi:hypothetical protein
VRRAPLVAVVVACACAVAPRVALERADRFGPEQARHALDAYDRVAARADATAGERARALTAGALACDRLGDAAGARQRLERAVEREVPGVTEPALYYLAERIVKEDRGRALNLYYRAAAGAERHRARGFPYREAMARIVELSLIER